MKKQLHLGARWLFRLTGFFSGFILLCILFGFSAATLSKDFKNINFIFGLGLLYIILFIIIAEIYSRMAYKRWFYDFTDNQLRLERGIIWKKYSNIPYERVQNVDITRGIIARICGFSTVNIQTAGFSYTPNKATQSEGYIPAVPMTEAENIREFLMKKISKKSSQGL
jgi:membrane protein YdbS with pleckstrin-like domain